MTDLPTRLARAICCPAGPCCSPTRCYAEDRTRSHIVTIPQAAEAVAAIVAAERAAAVAEYRELQCERWKAMSFNVDRGTP